MLNNFLVQCFDVFMFKGAEGRMGIKGKSKSDMRTRLRESHFDRYGKS